MRNLKKIRETDAGLLTSNGFINFFKCLIFEFFFITKADVVTIKDEKSK